MSNLEAMRDEIKAADRLSHLLTLEGLVVSSSRLDDESKIELLQFLTSIRGVSRSRETMKSALLFMKEEGVW